MPKVADAADAQRPPRERQSPRHHREEHGVADRQRISPVQQVAAYDRDGVEQRGRHADTGTVGERGHRAHHTCSLWTTRTAPPGARWSGTRTGAAVYFLSVSLNVRVITSIDPAD